jgi:hypothetical protein
MQIQAFFKLARGWNSKVDNTKSAHFFSASSASACVAEMPLSNAQRQKEFLVFFDEMIVEK